MLPFLKKINEASVAVPSDVIKRKPDEEPKDLDHLEMVMEELHNALMSKKYKEAAEVFKAAHELMEEDLHEEGPHLSEE